MPIPANPVREPVNFDCRANYLSGNFISFHKQSSLSQSDTEEFCTELRGVFITFILCGSPWFAVDLFAIFYFLILILASTAITFSGVPSKGFISSSMISGAEFSSDAKRVMTSANNSSLTPCLPRTP